MPSSRNRLEVDFILLYILKSNDMKPYNISHMIMSIGNHKKNYVMKINVVSIFIVLLALTSCVNNSTSKRNKNMDTLNLTQKWDKTFPKSDKVEHTKVTFHNRYGIALAADLYKPQNAQGRLAAIAVSGPYGAVKEQVSGRYAQTLAEYGFLTIAFDPSYYGESGGHPVI